MFNLRNNQEANFLLLTIPNNPGVAYGSHDGKFFKIDPLKRLERVLHVDVEGFLIYKCSVNKKNTKRKALTLAYSALYGSVPAGCSLYFKDSDSTNYKGYNIGCLPKQEYIKLKDANNNLKGDLKLVPHLSDSYAYHLVYRKDNKIIKVKFHDIVCALREKDRIYAESTIICGRYLLSAGTD